MATNILTSKALDALRIENSKTKERYVADGGGLVVRVRGDKNKPLKDWFFSYTHNGKRSKLSIGKYPVIELAEAREIAAGHRKTLATGIDPKQKIIDDALARDAEDKAKELALAKESARLTVRSLFDLWESLELINRKDLGREARRMFEKDVFPLIGELAVEDMRKAHIVQILDTMLARGIRRMVKLVLALMRQMFRFAQDRDLIENDPTASIRKAKVGGKDVVRERHLKEPEIRDLATRLPSARLLITTECALWIMLSTCCRIGELCKAQWKNLNIDEATWYIPDTDSKSGKPHTIYLSPFALAQFKTLLTLKQSEVWIYPNTDKTNYVCTKSITKQLGDRQLAEGKTRMSGRSKHGEALKLDGGKWTPHDLRRTGATTMGNLGIRPDVIEKCLNHTEENKMKKTYQHQSLIEEQKQAWEILGARLEILISNNTQNVVSIIQKTA